jgi:hypothetical protein
MARQGNYVSVPGGSANWASGISGALSDLSKSLIRQGDEEEKAIRLDAAAEEDKRRYEADKLARTKAANESKRRYDTDRNDRLAQRQLQNARIKKQDDLVAKDRALLEQVNLFSNKDPNTLTYYFSDYGAEQRDAITNAKKALEAEQVSTEQFLNTGSKESLENALSVYEKNINLSGLPEEAKAAKIAERRNRLLAFGREAQGEGYSADQRSERVKSLVADLYNPQFSRIDDTIRRGVGLTQEGQFRAFARQLPDEVSSRFSRDELKKKFGTMLSAQSRDEILANENARVAAVNERAKEKIDLLDKYFMRVNQGQSSGYSGKRTGKDVLAAYGKISGMDIGSLDDARLVKQLNRLLDNENIDPMAAAAAITLGVDKDILGDSAYSVDDEEFSDIERRALALSGAPSKSKSSTSEAGSKAKSSTSKDKDNRRPSLSDYQYTPAKARELGDLLRSRVVLTGGGDYRLGVKDNYLEQLEAITNDKPKTSSNIPEPLRLPTPAPTELPRSTRTDALTNNINTYRSPDQVIGDQIAENLDYQVRRRQAEQPYDRFDRNQLSRIDDLESSIEGLTRFEDVSRRMNDTATAETTARRLAEAKAELAAIVANPNLNLLDMTPIEQMRYNEDEESGRLNRSALRSFFGPTALYDGVNDFLDLSKYYVPATYRQTLNEADRKYISREDVLRNIRR